MPVVMRIGAVAASALFLLAPAIWNRFPLLEYDTGGYLARWFEAWLVPSRSTVYGLFLLLFSRPDFWPVVIVQALVTVWVLALVLRATGFGSQPMLLPVITAALAVLTTLPWIAGVLLTDIFAGVAVLALYLLVWADGVLRRWEHNGLIALVAFAAASHSATFVLALGLLIGALLARRFLGVASLAGIVRGAAALLIGAVMLLSANFATSGHFVWTPGGMALSFGRMLQDGIVHRYLAEHCPDRRLPHLCAHRAELPDNADQFFWGHSVFDRLGRFQGLGGEMSTVVVDSMLAYPVWQAELAAIATARQLTTVATGEGVLNSVWHTYWAIDTFAPHAAADMHAARQQHGEIGFALINRIHQPVAYASMLLLVVVAGAGCCLEWFADLAALASTAILALLGNAVICGVFSDPHDRYGARLVWIAPLVIALALCRLWARQDHGQVTPLAAEPVPPG